MTSIVRKLISSPTVRTISGLAGGNLIALSIGVVGSLVQARYVSPSDLGYFRGFSIATGYAFFFHLGILDAFYRFYPYYIGKGEKERAEAMAEICQSWMIAVSSIVSSVFFVLAFIAIVDGNLRASLGWSVQVISIWSIIYGGYLGASCRSGHDFMTITKGTVLSSTVNLLTLPFFILWPYVALVVRSGLGSFVSTLYLHIMRPLRLKWRFNSNELLSLLKHGFPLFIATYGAGTFWTIIETSLVLHYLGTQALGYWSMSFMLLEMANKVPQAITAVYIPRVIEVYGKTGKVRDAMSLCRKPMIWGAISMLGMALSVSSLLPFVIPVLMPNYVAAIPTMSFMMFVLVLLILELPYSILVVMGKLAQQNFAVYLGVGCFLLCSLNAIYFGLGLNGIVISSLFGRTVKIIMTYVFIFRNEQADSQKANITVAIV